MDSIRRLLVLSSVTGLLLATFALQDPMPASAQEIQASQAPQVARVTRQPTRRPRAVQLDADLFYRVGSASGFWQTPRGGAPGTTSPRRPSLDETGTSLGQELGWRVRALIHGRHVIYASGVTTFLGGDDTIERDLISQASPFPAGTAVDSSSWLGLWRLGYRYRLTFPLGRCSCLDVRPGLGLTGLYVRYKLAGDNGALADRSYFHVAPHVDLTLAWRPRPGSRLWLSGEVSQTLNFMMPDSNQMDVFETSLRLNYDLSRRWTAFLETGYRNTDWRDAQTVPNHIHVEFGPWFGLGASFRF